jgi:hypothetical protein
MFGNLNMSSCHTMYVYAYNQVWQKLHDLENANNSKQTQMAVLTQMAMLCNIKLDFNLE